MMLSKGNGMLCFITPTALRLCKSAFCSTDLTYFGSEAVGCCPRRRDFLALAGERPSSHTGEW